MSLNPDEGTRQRDAGIERAADHAERSSPNWLENAIDSLHRFPKTGPFMTEELREWAHDHGLALPPHPRAWGAVMTRAKRLGIVEFIGHGQVANPKAHRTPASIWQKRRPVTN